MRADTPVAIISALLGPQYGDAGERKNACAELRRRCDKRREARSGSPSRDFKAR